MRRFRREARVAAGLSHPNLVRVFDFGDDPRPYLVMEYVEGGTLTEHLREAGRELDCHGLVRGTDWTPLDDLDVAADVATRGPNVTVVSTGARRVSTARTARRSGHVAPSSGLVTSARGARTPGVEVRSQRAIAAGARRSARMAQVDAAAR